MIGGLGEMAFSTDYGHKLMIIECLGFLISSASNIYAQGTDEKANFSSFEIYLPLNLNI